MSHNRIQCKIIFWFGGEMRLSLHYFVRFTNRANRAHHKRSSSCSVFQVFFLVNGVNVAAVYRFLCSWLKFDILTLSSCLIPGQICNGTRWWDCLQVTVLRSAALCVLLTGSASMISLVLFLFLLLLSVFWSHADSLCREADG